MKREIKYELPIFSSTLEKDPVIKNEDMNIKIELVGVDEEDRTREIVVVFKTVICSKHTTASFVPTLYDSYDKIVELVDSEWLEELEKINKEKFIYWQPRHFVIYLDEVGMFQFIAQEYEVVECTQSE